MKRVRLQEKEGLYTENDEPITAKKSSEEDSENRSVIGSENDMQPATEEFTKKADFKGEMPPITENEIANNDVIGVIGSTTEEGSRDEDSETRTYYEIQNHTRGDFPTQKTIYKWN